MWISLQRGEGGGDYHIYRDYGGRGLPIDDIIEHIMRG